MLKGSLVVIAPGCKISNITINNSEEDPAVSLQSRDNQLIRCTIAGAAIALSATGENNTLLNNQIKSPTALRSTAAKIGFRTAPSNAILESR